MANSLVANFGAFGLMAIAASFIYFDSLAREQRLEALFRQDKVEERQAINQIIRLLNKEMEDDRAVRREITSRFASRLDAIGLQAAETIALLTQRLDKMHRATEKILASPCIKAER